VGNLHRQRVGGVTTYMDAVSPSLRARKAITFTGAANLGAVGAVPLFTVTGKVIVDRIVAHCTEDLVGAGTLALGVTGSTTLFIPATTGTDLDVGDLWLSNSPTAIGLALPAGLQNVAIAANIIGTVAANAITDGTLEIDVFFTPISADGGVVAA